MSKKNPTSYLMDNGETVDSVIEKEREASINDLMKEISKLNSYIDRLKEVIVKNELEDEIPDMSFISTEEQICVNGIKHIANLVQNLEYSPKDITNFDILYKILRSIKGLPVSDQSGKKKPQADVKELLKIVSGKQ